jgi:hypothetical protein
MIAHPIRWQAPQPLWARFGATVAAAATAPDQTRPAILGFKTDEFADQLIAMLAADPRQLGQVIARPETWRSPTGETPDLVERVPLPRIARALARRRKGRAARTAVDPTTDVLSVNENGVTRALPLKLYHPAHQRHYLVAANLVCGLAGFPDHALGTGGGEQVGFVLRRLLPVTSASDEPREEYAFVRNGSARWQRVSPDAGPSDPFARSVDHEEMLPLFPVSFRDDTDHPRRLLAGLIPVGRREEYMTSGAYRQAPTAVAPSSSTTGTPTPSATPAPSTAISERKEQFKLDVAEPWKNLVRAAHATRARMYDPILVPSPSDVPQRRTTARQFNEQAQSQSWLILLDFADYLAHHLPNVWDAVQGGAPRTPLTNAQQRLLTWLNGADPVPASGWQLAPTQFVASMREALRQVSTQSVRTNLERADNTYPHALSTGLSWPSFFYLLAGVRETSALERFNVAGKHQSLATLTGLTPDPNDVEATPSTTTAETEAAYLDKLVQLVVGAIDVQQPAAPTPPVPFAAQLRDAMKTTQGDPGWFVLRCVYVRTDCGPLHPPVLSARSQRFQLASFFDPDAPARPIRIALPIDTTAAGMRKFNKNTAFVISDALCGQLQRAKGLGLADLVLSVLPWPFHKDLDVGAGGIGPCKNSGGNLGMICSLSIPIITICALILLMMIVLVLDMIFKWIPWFIVCFPLPGFKAKK